MRAGAAGGLLLLLLLFWAEGVLGAPEDHCQKVPFIGFEGKDVVLQPEVNGIPVDITWKKDKKIVHEWNKDSADSSSSYILRNVSQSDAGNYIAEVHVENILHCTNFHLKILDYLRTPDLNCSVHNGDIQVNCTSPQTYSHSISVSYLLGYSGNFTHKSSILLSNADLSKQITCIISVFGVNASSSTILSECIPEDYDHSTGYQRRIRGLFVIPVLIIVLAVFLLTKGYIRKCTHRDHPGIADSTRQPLNELNCVSENPEENSREGTADSTGQPLNELNHVSENPEENSREDVSEDQETSFKEESLSPIVPKPDSGSAENLEENEGASITGQT